MAGWILPFGRSMVTAQSKFWGKNYVPATCSLEEFSSNTNQDHNLTWLQSSAKGAVVSQVVTLFFVAMNGKEQTPFL